MTIEENIRNIEKRIARACERAGRSPDEVTLVAVTKTFPPEAIEAAFEAGLRDFGENRVQEAEPKIEQLKNLNLAWHMVGHLQTNKAKTALQLFDIIHSVDSIKLAEALSRRTERKIPILLEVNLSKEATKYGFTEEEISSAIKQISSLPNLEIKGLMTMAPYVTDPEEMRPVFHRLRELRDMMGLEQLSMGMTDDFEVAIEEGATIVRIGRAIFGGRR